MVRVGVSSCFMHADPTRAIFKGKTLLYLVEDVGRWLIEGGAMPVLIPTLAPGAKISLPQIVRDLDGLVLQGGADVAPASYGEHPLRPEWAGDAVRDRYELALVEEFHAHGKPIFGICRGLQLLNVACKGTLYQDITHQVPGSLTHRNWDIYDQNFHEIQIVPKTKLAALYGDARRAKVNSIHHQGIKNLGTGLRAEAFSVEDGIVEAVRADGDDYVVGVQWHPEFQDPHAASLLRTQPLLDEFLEAVRRKKQP